MKALIDCRLMYYRKAGITQYTRRLVRAMFSTGVHQPFLLLDRRDNNLGWVPAAARVVRAITPAHHRLERWALPLELRVLNLHHPFDILHSPDFITCAGRFKKVITIHDLYFMHNASVMDSAGAGYYHAVGRSARVADQVIAVSDFTKSDIVQLLGVPATKIMVVYEAADEPRSRETISDGPAAAGNQPAEPYALFLGTIEPRKNLPTLLRALALAPGVRLVLAGAAGWGDDNLDALARELRVVDRLTFVPQVDDAERDRLLRHARCLVLPSLYEGFGLPPLEAMARGVPVICSNAGSLPEVVGDAAFMHDPLDHAALAAHLALLWSDPGVRDTLAAKGRAQQARFSWERAAGLTEAVYRRAIGAP